MFGSNNKKEVNKSKGKPSGLSTSSHALNSLVQGTVVEGTVKSKNDIRIDGTIKGKLFCDAKVIIGPTGAVEGEIHCQNAVIEGNFQGMLEVKELLNVRDNAKISGEVSTNKLIVQSGATFNVSCSMGGKLSGQNRSTPSDPSASRTKPSKENQQKENLARGSKAAGAQ